MRKTIFHRSLCCLVALLLAAGNVPMAAASDPFAGYEEIQLLKGDIATIPAKTVSRVSITDPKIADVSDAKSDEVSVVGNEAGQTVLFVWDESGKRTILVRVVEEDLAIVKARIEKLLQSANIIGLVLNESVYEGKVVLTGALPEDKMTVLNQVLEPFNQQIINLVSKEVVEDLVQIDMQVTELSTTLTKELGIDWTTGTEAKLVPAAGETLPTATGKFGDLFKIGDFNRTNALLATVNALVKEGKAKILSKPRLVVVNGKEASFLVGGEIPIRTTTTSASGGSTQQNVEFKEYGVSLSITPVIRNGKVDIVLSVEISDVDSSKSTSTDVAFLTRSAQTQLFLDDRQTIVLAGLIKKRDNIEVSKVPLLGSIPFVGALFRSKKTPVGNEDTEVVISLTPTVIRSSAGAKNVFIQNFPAPTTKAAAAPALPQDIGPYAKTVQEKISGAIAYPVEAQQNGWQGTVKLELVLANDGSLRDVYVKESSGYDVFDQDAVNTAQIVAPYGAFPASVSKESLSLTVPIVYSMDAFLKNVAKRN